MLYKHFLLLSLIKVTFTLNNPYDYSIDGHRKYNTSAPKSTGSLRRSPPLNFNDNAEEKLIFTKYINEGQIIKARNLSLVTEFSPNVVSHAGFFTVDSQCDSNIFMWFFPSQNNPEKDPLTIWHQGGPGITSLHGALHENGPYKLTFHNTLELREFAWNRNSSLIYFDSPVGTGFSYTAYRSCYATNKFQVGSHIVIAMKQFFQVFPELKNNELYVTGQSYGGHFVPAVAYTMHVSDYKFNLKGIAIGNGFFDPLNQVNYFEFCYQIGLTDHKLRSKDESTAELMAQAITDDRKWWLRKIWRETIDELEFASGFRWLYNFLYAHSKPQSKITDWIKLPQVRSGLHTGNASFHHASDVLVALLDDSANSVKPLLEVLLEHYRVLTYNGQLDLILPFPDTASFLRRLQWSGSEQFLNATRQIWREKSVLGYVTTGGNLTEVLVRNAGHAVPIDQPELAFKLFNNFISNQQLVN